MSIEKACQRLPQGVGQKFVGIVEPPRVVISLGGFRHAGLAMMLGLARGVGKDTFVPIDPDNFRAGLVFNMGDNELALGPIESFDFPSSKPTETEFRIMLSGTIEIVE